MRNSNTNILLQILVFKNFQQHPAHQIVRYQHMNGQTQNVTNFPDASADILSGMSLWQLGFEHVTNARYFCPVVNFVTLCNIRQCPLGGSFCYYMQCPMSVIVCLVGYFFPMCNVQCQLVFVQRFILILYTKSFSVIIPCGSFCHYVQCQLVSVCQDILSLCAMSNVRQIMAWIG